MQHMLSLCLCRLQEGGGTCGKAMRGWGTEKAQLLGMKAYSLPTSCCSGTLTATSALPRKPSMIASPPLKMRALSKLAPAVLLLLRGPPAVALAAACPPLGLDPGPSGARC